MISDRIIIVPGYLGSGPGHWQTWLESRLPRCRRVTGITWEKPELAAWSQRIHKAIDGSKQEVWIVAHSFGCLASVVAASEQADKVAGIVLVAPADPDRFSPDGLRQKHQGKFLDISIDHLLPPKPLPCLSNVIIASENDPWLSLPKAKSWAERWGSTLINAGKVGHINAQSGFGPWPFILILLDTLREHAAGKLAGADRRRDKRVRNCRTETPQCSNWRSISFTI